MNRRDAVLALLALLAKPRISFAQQKKVRRIGILALSSKVIALDPLREVWDRSLKELGWIEGRNVVIEKALADGKPDRFPELAAGLVRNRVDLIYAPGPDAVVEAARATKTIPIVFFGSQYPIEQGLVDSFARPGRNVTGVAWSDSYVKQLEFVKQVSPHATRVAYFLLPTVARKVNGDNVAGSAKEVEATGKSMGLDLQSFRIARQEDFDDAFAAIKAWRAQALIVYTSPPTAIARQRIIDFANTNKIPSYYDWRGFAESGGLFSYGPLPSAMTVQAVGQIDRILRGSRPAEVPVELPTRYEFVINRKTADALGLRIPQDLLVRADDVIL